MKKVYKGKSVHIHFLDSHVDCMSCTLCYVFMELVI